MIIQEQLNGDSPLALKNVAVPLFYISYPHNVGRDSSVGIVTRYGLDGPGIESRWGRDFSAPVLIGPGAHPASYTMDTGSFPGENWPGRGLYHPPTSSTQVKERVELAFVACSSANFTFILTTALHRGWEIWLSRGEYVSHCACARQGYESTCEDRDLNTQTAVKIGSVFCTPLNVVLCCMVKLVELHN
jgi:hypothetical protein